MRKRPKKMVCLQCGREYEARPMIQDQSKYPLCLHNDKLAKESK